MAKAKKSTVEESPAVVRRPRVEQRPNSGGTFRFEPGATERGDKFVEVESSTQSSSLKERGAPVDSPDQSEE